MPTKIDGNNGVLQSYDFQALTTGFSYTFATGTTTLIINPAGTLATGTITMPGSPADGMVITFTTTQEITAITINGNTGQSIGGSQVSLMAANSAMSFVYRLSNTTWYRNSAPALGNVGTAPVYAARAWVNFNGTGTVAIRASSNVSSITDNGTGNYTVNLTTSMTDANYSVVANHDADSYADAVDARATGTLLQTLAAGSFILRTYVVGGAGTNQQTARDYTTNTAAIFR